MCRAVRSPFDQHALCRGKRRICDGGADGRIKVWEWGTGELVEEVVVGEGGGGGLGGLGLRIGILLLRGGDGMVKVWRRESGEVCGELRGGGGDVWRFSNHGGVSSAVVGRSGGWSCGI